MAKLYQLMIEKSQINDLYYDRDDAIENAKQLVRDKGMPITVWVAEDIEGVSVDVLDWTILTTIRLIEYTVGMARDGTGAVDYMSGYVMTEDGVIELYAEAPSDETGTYEALRMEILKQADEKGVDGYSLVFCYDD